MTPHQTLAVAIRLFAIGLTLYAAHELAGFYIAGHQRDDAHVFAIVAVLSCVGIVVAAILWFFPRTIARGLLPLAKDTPAPPSEPQAWFAVGSSLIGLWLVATALPGLLRNLFVLYLYRAEPMETSGLTSSMAYLLVQLVVGAALIVWADSIRRFVWWARRAGRD